LRKGTSSSKVCSQTAKQDDGQTQQTLTVLRSAGVVVSAYFEIRAGLSSKDLHQPTLPKISVMKPAPGYFPWKSKHPPSQFPSMARREALTCDAGRTQILILPAASSLV